MKMLKTTMMLNAGSCIIFGLIFVLASSSVNSFIGNQYAWLTPLVGAVLIVNGVHLFWASQRVKPVCMEILYFIAGDLAWVIASIIFVTFGVVVTTASGMFSALVIALAVGGFAVFQFIGFKNQCQEALS